MYRVLIVLYYFFHTFLGFNLCYLTGTFGPLSPAVDEILCLGSTIPNESQYILTPVV